MNLLYAVALVVSIIRGSYSKLSVDNCSYLCKEWKERPNLNEEPASCKCRFERGGDDVSSSSSFETTNNQESSGNPSAHLNKRDAPAAPKGGIVGQNTPSAHLSKRDAPAAPKGGIVGQSNPSAHQRLIHQRARQRLHQQRGHHGSSPAQHRRIHHGHARQHVTPHHRPHLVGSVRERFGGEKEQGGVLKRLRERQKQRGEAKQAEGGDVREAEPKQEEKQQQNFDIITQPSSLVDGK